MTNLFTALVTALNPTAVPLVLVCIVTIYLWFRFGRVQKDREVTKAERDKDSQIIHDKLLTHDFKISELQGIVNLHRDKLDSIDKQLGIVNQELVKLNIQVEHLANALEKQNEIMLQQLKK